MKLTKIESQKNGFYLCIMRGVYYNNLSTTAILPLKNGYLFNPEYQHSFIEFKTRLSIIENYHGIKKMIRRNFENGKNSSDLNYYKINN